MTDPLKHLCPDGGTGNLLSDLKTLFSVLRNRKTKMFVYGFIFTFVACTVYIAFSPSTTNSSAPWFSSVFNADRSHFPTFISHFFSSSSSLPVLKNGSLTVQHGFAGNETMGVAPSKKLNQTVNGVSPKPSKESNNGTSTSGVSVLKPSEDEKKKMEKKEEKSNSTSGFSVKKPSEGKSEKKMEKKEDKSNSISGISKAKPLEEKKIANETKKKTEKKVEFSVESMVNCNIFDGRWVRDDSYPLYAPGSCPHIDEPFNCYLNSRPDRGYQNFRWQPSGCNIPRLEGKKMLELLRGKRLVFVGDSLNRNMWESLVCVLRNSVEDKSKVFEASGRREFRTEGSYSFVFKDYNCSVEFFRSPFLVQEWEMPENGSKHETLRLDLVERSSSKYKNADVMVFNTGHWWTHEKTAKGKDYYQEGSHIYGELGVADAFRKALTTWARWVDANVDHKKSTVFFRGYSASHFRGGRWNSGGQCDSETDPITNDTYLAKYPSKMRVLESVMKGMKTPVFYLNITRLTDYRKDAHPSIYRKQYLSEEERKSPLRFQDCSHWCLPGVPDTWNELLYAQLLIKQYGNNHHQQEQQQQKHQMQKGR